jgi:hypothetical protein
MILPGLTQSTKVATHHFSKQEFEDLDSGKCAFYIFGSLGYCDIFKHAHWRHYCWGWVPHTPDQFAACPVYNDGDDDYPEQKPIECKN